MFFFKQKFNLIFGALDPYVIFLVIRIRWGQTLTVFVRKSAQPPISAHLHPIPLNTNKRRPHLSPFPLPPPQILNNRVLYRNVALLHLRFIITIYCFVAKQT